MIIPTKTYEKPESGIYHGVLADIVDLGQVTITYKGTTSTTPRVQFVWFLDKTGSDGKPLQVRSRKFNVSNFHEKSHIYQAMKMILGHAPDVKQDIDSVLGVTRQLVIQRDRSTDGTQDYANIIGIAPGVAGVTVPVPAGFVRDRDKPVNEQQKYRQLLGQNQQPKPTQQPGPAPVQPQPVQPVVSDSLEAQIARLQAQQKALLEAAAKKADVNFNTPSNPNF